MKQKIYSMMFSIILVLSLLLIVWINASVYVGGVARKWESDDRLHWQTVMQRYQLHNLQPRYRHVHQTVTYIYFDQNTEATYYWFDRDGFFVAKVDVQLYSMQLQSILSQLNIENSEVQLGYYQQPVFVYQNKNRTIYISLEMEIVFDYIKENYYVVE